MKSALKHINTSVLLTQEDYDFFLKDEVLKEMLPLLRQCGAVKIVEGGE